MRTGTGRATFHSVCYIQGHAPALRVSLVSPARTGLLAFAVTSAWFFVLSGLLGTVPGEPVGSRIDAYFQNDAGGRIADAATGAFGRAVIIHPLYYFVFTLPISKLAWLLSGWCSPELTALYACRLFSAIAVGVGVGRLCAALVRFGVSPLRLALVGPLFLLGTAQTLTALPDHFALSAGLLCYAFAVFLDDRTGHGQRARLKLIVLTFLAWGITVTNGVFPAALLGWRWVDGRRSLPRWVLFASAGVVLLGVAFAAWVASFDPRDHSNPLVWRVRGYLTGRLLNDPAGAAARALRGLTDSAVGPTPAIDNNNFDKTPMLTYEPTYAEYRAWPFDAVQGTSAAVWLALLGIAVALAVRNERSRWPAVVLLGWVGGCLGFHLLWGDEFFLYAPHYSWALAAVVALGVRSLPAWMLAPPVAAVAVGQVWTLLRIRERLAELPF